MRDLEPLHTVPEWAAAARSLEHMARTSLPVDCGSLPAALASALADVDLWVADMVAGFAAFEGRNPSGKLADIGHLVARGLRLRLALDCEHAADWLRRPDTPVEAVDAYWQRRRGLESRLGELAEIAAHAFGPAGFAVPAAWGLEGWSVNIRTLARLLGDGNRASWARQAADVGLTMFGILRVAYAERRLLAVGLARAVRARSPVRSRLPAGSHREPPSRESPHRPQPVASRAVGRRRAPACGDRRRSGR